MPADTAIRLSPSSLNLFVDCPRCFWLEKRKGVRRPRGIFPSLPGGMDLVIKAYFDRYRTAGTMPPELAGKAGGALFGDSRVLERWRSWQKTDLCYRDEATGARLSGALDDCLVDDGYYVPVDYKTRGSALIEDPATYYQTQLDCYCLILDASGYRTKGLAYLVFYWPTAVTAHGVVAFHTEPVALRTDVAAAKKVFVEALETVSSPIPPLADPECEYCAFVAARRHAETASEDRMKG